MNIKVYKLKGRVWLYPGKAGWHFFTVPKTKSAEITKLFGAMAGGWGSLPVEVKLGTSAWRTSIFPDRKQGVYLLPMKSQVRKKEEIKTDDQVSLQIKIMI